LGVCTDEEELMELLFKDKTKEIRKEKGCSHNFDRETCKYCPECGSPAWEILDDDEWDFEDIQETLDDMGFLVYETEDGTCVGFSVHGMTITELNAEIKTETLRKMFNKEPEILSGEYYC
jgi:hypothetical protein